MLKLKLVSSLTLVFFYYFENGTIMSLTNQPSVSIIGFCNWYMSYRWCICASWWILVVDKAESKVSIPFSKQKCTFRLFKKKLVCAITFYFANIKRKAAKQVYIGLLIAALIIFFLFTYRIISKIITIKGNSKV